VVAAAQAGDPQALRAVYDKIHPLVAYVIGALAGHTADFADLCNEICAEVLLNITRYRGEGAFIAWVWAVVVRQIGSWRKRRRIERALLRRANAHAVPRDAQPTPDELLVWQESQRLAGREILRLPQRMYMAVTLVDLAEMTPSEVAALIGGTPRSITNASYRAKLRIQERLIAAGLLEPNGSTAAPIIGGLHRPPQGPVVVGDETVQAIGVEHDARD
jgi:RNA polymerase sigma factor (sigma-70 family)